MKRITSLLLTVLYLQLSAQEFTENFDGLNAGDVISSSNTQFMEVRIGSGGGAIDALHPSSIGRGASMRLGGSTSNSQNNVKSDSLGTSSTSSFHVSLYSSNSSLGDLYIGVGKYGTSISSNANLNQNDLQWAIKIDNGLIRYRSKSGSWLSSSIRITDNELQEFYVLVNGSASAISYGNEVLDTASMDIWLNGMLVAEGLEVKNAQPAEAFKIYQTNGAQFYEIDDIRVFLTIEQPLYQVTYDGNWSKPQAPHAINSNYGWSIEDSLQLDSSYEVSFISVAEQSELRLHNGSSVLIFDSLQLNGSIIVEDSGAVLLDSNLKYTGNGIFEVRKNLPLTNAGYVYLSSPTGSLPKSKSNLGTCYSYEPSLVSPGGSADQAWQPCLDSLKKGKGYASYWGNSDTAVFQGIPFYKSLELSLDSNQVVSQGTWNLVGNPYPTGLSLAKFLNHNSNVSNNIYCWNGNTAAYELYDASSGVDLSSAQAFFVFYLKDSTSILRFLPSMRSKNMQALTKTSSSRLDLNLKTDSSSSLIRIKFNDRLNNKTKLREQLPFSFATGYADLMALDSLLNPYSVLAYPPVDSFLHIPLKVLTTSNQAVSITVNHKGLNNLRVYLQDLKLLNRFDLSRTQNLLVEPKDSLRFILILENENWYGANLSVHQEEKDLGLLESELYYDVNGQLISLGNRSDGRSRKGIIIRKRIYSSGAVRVDKIIH